MTLKSDEIQANRILNLSLDPRKLWDSVKELLYTADKGKSQTEEDLNACRCLSLPHRCQRPTIFADIEQRFQFSSVLRSSRTFLECIRISTNMMNLHPFRLRSAIERRPFGLSGQSRNYTSRYVYIYVHNIVYIIGDVIKIGV